MPDASSKPAATVQRVPEGTTAAETAVSRLHAFASHDVADFPVPTGREEEWRFTPLRRIRGLHQGEAPDRGPDKYTDKYTGKYADRDTAKDTAKDGQPDPAARVVTETDAPPEVRVETVGPRDHRIGRAYTPTDRVSALALGSFSRATVVTVPKETVASRPTVLSVYGKQAADGPAAGPDGAEFGHVVVEVEPFAQAVLVFDHQGSATYADNVEFSVGDGASLSVVSVQDWADDTVHMSHHHARLGRDAHFKHTAVTLGGDLVRMVPSVRYAGPGGNAELLGVYFADAGQHLEHRLFVDHAVHDCRSRVSYKGALQGEDAHTVWIGDVMIRAEATGTDTYEYNRNLVLTDGTRADSVPNLEILTGEVIGAGHASASGRLEDHHLFYLMARGISYREARRLVIRGFFGELIDRIDVPEVRSRAAEAVEAELERSAL